MRFLVFLNSLFFLFFCSSDSVFALCECIRLRDYAYIPCNTPNLKCDKVYYYPTQPNGRTIYFCGDGHTAMTPNCPTCDDDGDGLPNKCEPDHKYTFSPDQYDPDLCSALDHDGDGKPNDVDPDYAPDLYDPDSPEQDFDNDGKPNNVDNDDDGDGWPDPLDPHPGGFDDDDNDGLPDYADPDYNGIRYDGTDGSQGGTGNLDGSGSHIGGGSGVGGNPADGGSGGASGEDLCLNSPSCECIPQYAQFLGMATLNGNICCEHYKGRYIGTPDGDHSGQTFNADLHCNCVQGACDAQEPNSQGADVVKNAQLVEQLTRAMGKNLSGPQVADQLSNLRQGLKYDNAQFFNQQLENDSAARNYSNNEANDRHNKLVDHISDATNISNSNDNQRHRELLAKVVDTNTKLDGTNSKLSELNSKFGVGDPTDDNPAAVGRVEGAGSAEGVIDGFFETVKNSPVTGFLKNSGIQNTAATPVLTINNPLTNDPVSVDFSQWGGSFAMFGNLLLGVVSMSMGLYIFRG